MCRNQHSGRIEKRKRARCIFLPLVALLFLTVFMAIPTDLLALQRGELPLAASALADEIAATGKHSVAVVDFTDLQGNVTELGRFMSEEVELGLVTAKRNLTVVDRTHLRLILQENKLDATGLVDPATARKVGVSSLMASMPPAKTGALSFTGCRRLRMKKWCG